MYKKLAFLGALIFTVSTVFAQNEGTSSSANNSVGQTSSKTESLSNQSSNGNSQASSDGAKAKQKKPETPQQVNAQGQDALNGTTAEKEQMAKDKLKVQSEKYQAEIAKEKQQSNATGAQSLQNNTSQSGGSSGYQAQQNAQIQAADQTKNIMPQPTLMQAESNQDEAENMQADSNKQQFYNPQENQ